MSHEQLDLLARILLLICAQPAVLRNSSFANILPLLLLLVCRPGAAAGLSQASLQYSVMQPSASPALGAPLAVTVVRKGSDTPMFDTTGHRWVYGDEFI